MAIFTTQDQLEMQLARAFSSEGVVLQNGISVSDPFPEIYYEIPGVEYKDRFVFIFRQTAFMDNIARSPAGTPQMTNVIFVMPLNPAREERSQAKNINFTLTNEGYVINNWGNGLINLVFSGTTGRMVPEDEYTQLQMIGAQLGKNYPGYLPGIIDDILKTTGIKLPSNIRETMAWRIFSKFNYFYQYFNGGNEYGGDLKANLTTPRTALVTLLALDRVFVGALTDFKYTVDANDPWQIKYNFTFVSLPIQESIGRRTPVYSLGQVPQTAAQLALSGRLDQAQVAAGFDKSRKVQQTAQKEGATTSEGSVG